MSFILDNQVITDEMPKELEGILKLLKANTREKSKELMETLSHSEKYMAYLIPKAGMVIFADDLTEERKVCRYLISPNGELFIDNKQRRGEMFCPLFDSLEKQIMEETGRVAETVSDDKEYKRYDSFMPKIVATINDIIKKEVDIFH